MSVDVYTKVVTLSSWFRLHVKCLSFKNDIALSRITIQVEVFFLFFKAFHRCRGLTFASQHKSVLLSARTQSQVKVCSVLFSE